MFLDGDDCDATFTIDGETLNPGDVGIVLGVLMRPEHNCDKLSIGKAMLLREGARTIAYGVIVWHTDQRTIKSLTSLSRSSRTWFKMPGIAVDDSWETVRQVLGAAGRLTTKRVLASLEKACGRVMHGWKASFEGGWEPPKCPVEQGF